MKCERRKNMATTILVDTAQIAATKTKIEGFKEEFNASWNKVMTLKNEITQNCSGVDISKFNDQVEGFRDDFQALEGKLQDYIQFLVTAKQTYDEAQDKVKTEASALATNR